MIQTLDMSEKVKIKVLNTKENFMRCFLGLAVLMLITGCGKPPAQTVIQISPPCTVSAVSGGSKITCPDGSSQTISNGAVGQIGPTGPQGAPGIDPTPTTAVQFCPGFTPSYPSVFAEYGICLGGQMYGVYSANGGFLALLPPGAYSSDGINATCNFEIEANCVVSQ